MMDLSETIRIWQKPLIIVTESSILDIKWESRSASVVWQMVFKYSLKLLSYTNTKYECAVIEKVMRNAIFNYCAHLVILVQPEKLVHNN